MFWKQFLMSGLFKTIVQLFGSTSLLVRLTCFIRLVNRKSTCSFRKPFKRSWQKKICLSQSHYLFPAIYNGRFLSQQNTIQQWFKIILIYFSYSLLQIVSWIMTVANAFFLDLIFIRCRKLEVPAGEILSSPCVSSTLFLLSS